MYSSIKKLQSSVGLSVLSLALSGCGFIMESISDFNSLPIKPPAPLNVPVQPIYLSTNTSYLKAEGFCQGYKVIEFTFSSPLTPTNTIFAKCADDKVSTKLPVLHGDQKQVFDVKIVGYLENPSQVIDLPPSITVVFDPPVSLQAGFAVTSGGRSTSSATMKILNQSVGEVVTGTITSPTMTTRNGLQGAIDP